MLQNASMIYYREKSKRKYFIKLPCKDKERNLEEWLSTFSNVATKRWT